MPVDKNGVYYTPTTLEEATHLILLNKGTNSVNTEYENIAIPILNKKGTSVNIAFMNGGTAYRSGDGFTYTLGDSYTLRNREEILCTLGDPEPATIEDIKRHLSL